MTDEDDGGLVHIATQTMSTMGPDGPNGGGMTHTFWSARSPDELVRHYTDILGVTPDWQDDNATFSLTNEDGRRTQHSVTVVEEALGHRDAPPRAEAIVTMIKMTTMRPPETRILAPKSEPKQEPAPKPEPAPQRRRWWQRLR